MCVCVSCWRTQLDNSWARSDGHKTIIFLVTNHPAFIKNVLKIHQVLSKTRMINEHFFLFFFFIPAIFAASSASLFWEFLAHRPTSFSDLLNRRYNETSDNIVTGFIYSVCNKINARILYISWLNRRNNYRTNWVGPSIGKEIRLNLSQIYHAASIKLKYRYVGYRSTCNFSCFIWRCYNYFKWVFNILKS